MLNAIRMMTSLAKWIGPLIMLAAAVPAAAAKSSTDGEYGGSTGSSRQLQMEVDSARQRGNLERNLGRGNSAPGSGVEVNLRIAFPPGQRGLANITSVELAPEDGGTHSSEALAIVDRSANMINATFTSRKDVKAGHVYQVIVSDSRGGKYAVGRINLKNAAGIANFDLSAPLLGAAAAATSSAQGQSAERPRRSAPAYVAPSTGSGYVAPGVGPGYIAPQVGPGYVSPGTGRQ